jgi:acetyl esterase/lipase
MTSEQAQGLPPSNLNIGRRDIFRDESIEYCAKLAKAGVSINYKCFQDLNMAWMGSVLVSLR